MNFLNQNPSFLDFIIYTICGFRIIFQNEALSDTYCCCFFGKFTDLFNPCAAVAFHPADEEGPESDDEEEEDDNDVSPLRH